MVHCDPKKEMALRSPRSRHIPRRGFRVGLSADGISNFEDAGCGLSGIRH